VAERTTLPVALTIAGSDSGGGAGIQADLRTFALFKIHGASVLTAVTAQNTLGVSGIRYLSPSFVEKQIVAVFSDLSVSGVKTGLLGGPKVVSLIARYIRHFSPPFLVVDPVLLTHGGEPLLPPSSRTVLEKKLIPLATVVTPNFLEGELFLGRSFPRTEKGQIAMGGALLDRWGVPVLLKGGHTGGKVVRNVLFTPDGERYSFTYPRVSLRTHGTGCHLASAILSFLISGKSLKDAVSEGGKWVYSALKRAIPVGKGAVPPAPFFVSFPFRKGEEE
jgi:hydroxymethylpyrimidine/phosphomethylpyrimidine kinase